MAFEKLLKKMILPVDPATFRTPNAASLMRFLRTLLLFPSMKTPARSLWVIELSVAALSFPASLMPSKVSV